MADKFSLKAIISAVDKLSPTLKGIRLNAKITQKSLGDISAAGGQLFKSLGISGLAAGAGLFGMLKSVVGESSKFEKFETVLRTVEGTADAAKASLKWVDKFSLRTPYDLDEVTKAFVEMRAFGLDPTKGAMQSVADAAAGMDKDIVEVASILNRATVGENDGLKQFGITAKKVGDDILYMWNENGEEMVTKARANSKAQIEAVVTGIWNRKYEGAAAELSNTWEGIYSNIKGQYLNLVRFVGTKGFFDKIKQQAQGLLKVIERWEADGTLERLAGEISNVLSNTVEDLSRWVQSVNWAEFYQGVKSTVIGIRDFVSAIGGLNTILIAVGIIMLAGPVSALLQIGAAIFQLLPILIALGKGFLFLVAANPVMLAIIAVVVALGAAVYAIYKNWDPLKGWFENLWTGIKAIFQQGWENLKTMLSWSPLGLIMQAWGPVAEFFTGLWKTVSNISGAAPVQTSAPTTNAPGGGNNFNGLNGRTQLNGEMTVKFENAPPGMRVDPGKTNQPGLAMNPDVGYRQLAYTL
jgi:hypothetical protein